MKSKLLLLLFSLLVGATSLLAQNVDYVEPYRPFSESPAVRDTAKGDVDPSRTMLVPLITWAADGVTVDANGGLEANPNSPLARAVGHSVQLEVIDDFDRQVANYVSGKSPFLRGTADMIALVSQALKEKDPGLEPVVFLQLSTSTGADGFVAVDIEKLADLKGKTIALQLNGPHLSLVGNMLKDAGLQPTDVNLKFVREITTPPGWNPDEPAQDPANALRRDKSLAGAAMIFPDILATTGDGVGTGQEGTVKGARPIFTTKTADNVIFDVYAVRKDFLASHPDVVEGFRQAQLEKQEEFLRELENVAKKGNADRRQLEGFKDACRPLAGIFLQDEGAVNDYILWVGVDSRLAGKFGNAKFFDEKNPVGFRSTTDRIQAFLSEIGLIKGASTIAYIAPKGGETMAPAATPAKQTFASAQAVRAAAESKDASTLYSYTFQFPASMSDMSWRDYPEVFAKIHETVVRYGGAIVQLQGHADNFFANFVAAKRKRGETTYERRNKSTGQFEKLPLPKYEEILNDANTLSYSRAFAVKKAYAAYVREALGLSPDEVDMSRFDVRGMGISKPVVANPTTPEQRAENMRGEMVIIAAEAEIPADFGADDLR